MAIKVVKISQLYGKDLFAASGQKVNVRSGPGTYSKVLRTMGSGERIGTVSTHAEGRNDKGDKDGSIWLQLTEKYGNPSGFGAWVKFMPNAFSWKELKQQGAQTVEEEEEEKKEKEKTALDKITSTLTTLAVVWLIGKAVIK